MGSIYVLPGSGEVVTAVFDPAFAAYSGGLHRYSTTSGVKQGTRELYNQNISTYFGKSTGFGAITAGCGTLDAQIGNLVWIDTDCDGVQDADEAPLAGISVELYDTNCTLLSTKTTDANGNYSFTEAEGVTAGQEYFIVLDRDSYDSASANYSINGVLYAPTINASNGLVDSDFGFGQGCPGLNGLPFVSAVVGSGANDLSFDLGLKPSCLLYTSPSPRDATLSRMPSSA